MRRLTGWRADLAAAILGGVTALALPPVTFAPALVIGLSGLLVMIDGTASWRGALRRGFAFGLIHHLLGLYWVTEAVLVEAAEFWWAIPLAVPALAGALAVFIAIPCALSRLATPGWRRICVLAGAWVLGDLARQFALTGFPWNPLGSATEMPGLLGLVFMQPAAWIGVGGLTLLTVLLAGAPALGRRALAPCLAGLCLWAGLGAVRLHRAQSGPPPGLTVVLIQGNVSETEHRDHWQDRAWADAIFERHLRLTRQGIAQAAREHPGQPIVAIWPETSSPYWLQQDAPARQAVAEAAHGAVAAIAGTARQDGQRAYNSLVAVMPDGSLGGIYDKHHLVPYGEYFPSYLPIRLGERGWDAGPGLRTLHIAGLPPLGPLICYESAFSAQVVVEADRPAALVNITNDSWFGTSAGPRQHLAAARMRAVEEGLPLLRAANTGISAVIDAHGAVVTRLGLERQGIVVAAVPGVLARTPASRMGLAAPCLMALLCCCMGFLTGIARKL